MMLTFYDWYCDFDWYCAVVLGLLLTTGSDVIGRCWVNCDCCELIAKTAEPS